MKKVSLIILLLCLAISSFAQNHVAIQVAPYYAVPNDWTTNSFELNAQYVRDLGKVFHIGVGLGVGTSKPRKYQSAWKLDNIETRESALFFPIFVKAKVDFGVRPSHAFLAIKGGTKLSSVEGFNGNSFNPYVANVSPSIGYDIKIGNHKLGIELILDAIIGRYQEINYEYSELLNKYIYKDFTTKSDSIWAGLGLGITFEF